MVRDVGIIHIRPETDCSREILPHTLILPHGFLALFDKGLHAVLLDLLLAVEPQKFLNLKLDRKTMRIPSRLPRHHISLHGAVARNHILDDARQHMPDMRLAVCSRRSVIESVRLALPAAVHTLLKDIVVLPEFFYILFSVHKIQVCVYLIIHFFFSFHFFHCGAMFSSPPMHHLNGVLPCTGLCYRAWKFVSPHSHWASVSFCWHISSGCPCA